MSFETSTPSTIFGVRFRQVLSFHWLARNYFTFRQISGGFLRDVFESAGTSPSVLFYAPPIGRDGCIVLLTDKDRLLSLQSPCDKVGEVYCVWLVSDNSVGYRANCLALWVSSSQDTVPLCVVLVLVFLPKQGQSVVIPKQRCCRSHLLERPMPKRQDH
jgi:hypothetical protein